VRQQLQGLAAEAEQRGDGELLAAAGPRPPDTRDEVDTPF
jgi:hypothetical protein